MPFSFLALLVINMVHFALILLLLAASQLFQLLAAEKQEGDDAHGDAGIGKVEHWVEERAMLASQHWHPLGPCIAEEGEAEHSYTIKKYLSKSFFEQDDPYLSISFELEKECSSEESSFEIEYQDAEYCFEKITYKKDVYTFDIEGEKEDGFEYRGASLEILGEKHVYRFGGKEVVFSK